MSYNTYSNVYGNRNATPQSQPIPGREADMVKNSAGGYTFQVDAFDQVMRFLILGSEGGTYYISEKKLTQDSAKNVLSAIALDGKRVVDMVVQVSDEGRAPKNDPALFVMALCASFGDNDTKAYARENITKVARIPTHLFHFAAYVDGMRGWGPSLRKTVAKWYTDQDVDRLAYQIVKYVSRDKWSNADLLRLSHPKTVDETRNDLFKYIVDGWANVGPDPHTTPALQIVWAAERAKTASEKELLKLIADYNLPMECIPTNMRSKAVYEALLPNAPITFLIRNLGNLSKCGAIAVGQYSNLGLVTSKLTNENILRKGRVHPLALLVALNTYKAGHGVKGDNSWPVIPQVVKALEDAFYLSFKTIEPANKRFVLGVDVSGSMTCPDLAGMTGISPAVASACMALVTAKTEARSAIMGFATEFQDTKINVNDTLETAQRKIGAMRMGGTDCSLPMTWALKNKVQADAFVVYTDNETWAGRIQPAQALKDYRQKMGIDAKLIVVGMNASSFTIADPTDAGMLDVVGFDTTAPQVISAFAAGKI